MITLKRFVFALLLLPVSFDIQAEPLTPVLLRVEYKVNPLGTDIAQPRFSWQFLNTPKDQSQTAFEILVSDNLALLKQQKGDMWSSGKVASARSVNVVYEGKPLLPFTRYYWTVKVYNAHGETAVSDIAWFETAMLKDSDWTASWIDDGMPQPPDDADRFKPVGSPLFRKVLTIRKEVASARLYISGLGYYEALINGRKAGDQVLDPGWTAYGKEVLYAVHDVTTHFRSGTNAIGIALGNGWWNPLPIKLFGRWDIREYQETGRPCVKAEIHLVYSDGTKDVVVTDESWQTAEGPVMQNSVYLGEHYDARREIAGWATAAPGKANWKNAVKARGPSGRLSAQMQPPVKVVEVLKPVKITNPRPDTFIVDMGVNFAGVARIKVKGPAGTKISLRYAEDIFSDGTLNYHTSVMTQIRKGGIPSGPGAPPTAWQEDRYTLKGQGVETWAPRFTFHGFRYVEITGWPGRPTLKDIEGLRMSADLADNGSFECSNHMFNKVQEITERAFQSNVFSVQSDCPAREKLGYGADIVVTANAFIYNYDMATFYRKTVRDFANDQQEDGGITETAPFVGIADRGYGGYSGPLGWQLGFPFVMHEMYQFYGDTRIIEEFYPAFVKQMDFLQSKAVEGLFHWDIGDHEALDPRAEAFSAAAFYYHHAALASTFAGILNKASDSAKYARLAENIKRLIVRKYYVPGTGRFDNATQAAQIFALWYDLSPEEDRTWGVLMDEFERHNWHVSSGIFGVKMMFDILRQNDRNDIAFRIADQRDFPGWGHMVESGATTLWETWRYPEKYPSQNHPMFGSVSEWFYRSLLGINPGKAGFETIIIKPQPAGTLTWARGRYHSVRGVIESEWKKEGDVFTLRVAIPGNTSAEIWVPVAEGQTVSESGKQVERARSEKGYAVIKTGSGRFVFTAK
jgi:alpha-L-rhamnosidase